MADQGEGMDGWIADATSQGGRRRGGVSQVRAGFSLGCEHQRRSPIVIAKWKPNNQVPANVPFLQGSNNACYESHHPRQLITAAAKRVDETMRAHHLRVEAIALVSSPSSSGHHSNISIHQRARYSWTMYYAVSGGGGGNSGSSAATHHGHELVVGRGLVDTEEELYTAGFWIARRKILEV